jgi:hypothetical protein
MVEKQGDDSRRRSRATSYEPPGSYEVDRITAVRGEHAEEPPSERAEGLDPAFVHAWAELGFTLDSEATSPEASEKRQTPITTDDTDAWAKVAVGALTDAGHPTANESLADLAQETAAHVESLVAQTLLNGGDQEPGEELGRNVMGGYINDITNTIMVATLMRWLTAARESGAVDPTASLTWVRESLDWPYNLQAESAAGIIGQPSTLAPEIPAEMHQFFGPMFATVMIWLAAGIVATAGDGDAHWLRQFDGPWQGSAERDR